MAIPIDVNGQTINYPEIGDTNWADEATDFAVQTASAFGKLGLDTGTSVDIPGTLDVTGATTLDSTLTVGGNASVAGNTTITGNLTANGNSNLGNASGDTIAVTGILNVDLGVLYVDPTNSRVGINDTTPSVELDVNGSVAITGNETVGGALNVTGATTLSSTLAVNGNTTLGDASGDSLTINGNGVSIPNGLNFDSDTLVINAANNRVGIGVSSPNVPLDIQADAAAFSIDIKGRSADNIGLIRFLNNAGTARQRIGLYPSDALSISNAASIETFNIAQNGQLNAVVPGGSTLYPGYLCRAWVNFNGTLSGTIIPRGSGNVTSIADNNTGDYTVNFANPMPDVNYSPVITTSIVFGTAFMMAPGLFVNNAAGTRVDPTVNGFRIAIRNASNVAVDVDAICIGVFR